MKRHEYFTALGVVDKFFNTSEPEMLDGRLTILEHQNLCEQAEEAVRGIFPKYADRIMITPKRVPEDDFAGYRFYFAAQDGSVRDDVFEFDFGGEGIDVV